jgi:penicillin-binding protein 1B
MILVAALLAAALLLAEALAVARLDGDSLTGPLRLYARPPILALGRRADAEMVAAHLARLGYSEASERIVRPGQYALGPTEWLIVSRRLRRLGPLASGRAIRVRFDRWGRISSLAGAQGERFRAVPLEPEPIAVVSAAESADRVPMLLDDLPPHLIEAVLTIEDQRFFEHHGLDYRRIAGAALANLRDGRIVQGGSTITQQLARSLFLDGRRTLVRKAREAAMALVLEARHSKPEILQAYLNELYLGQDGGLAIHGVGRAAEQLFGKDAGFLDLAESALLAGLIRGPNLYSPLLHPERARARRDLVLRLMLERERIDDTAHRLASESVVQVRRRAPRGPPARYFRDHVLAVLGEVDPEASDHGTAGDAVVTTLDGELQRAAVAAVAGGLAALERDHVDGLGGESAGSEVQAALVAIDPRSGDVLAMVGGRDYGTSQYNRAVHARRQPGSAFKPIVALTAVTRRATTGEHEEQVTLASPLSDTPLEVETPAGPWRPVNYDGQFRGRVTLREALERSLNVPFARLGLELGPERVVDMARRLGIESPLKPYPSVALGAFEVTPLEMARAYGVLAAGGSRADSRSVLGVLTAAGGVRLAVDRTGERVVSAAQAYLVTSALRGAVERGTGRSLRALGYRGVVAAKSGTTNGFRDGWFIGYTPALAVAVWVGFDDGRSLGLPGSAVALPIFARFLATVTGRNGTEGQWGAGPFDVPSGLELVDVDPETGLRAGWGCPGRPELFLVGTAPRRTCEARGIRWDRGPGDVELLRRLERLASREYRRP